MNQAISHQEKSSVNSDKAVFSKQDSKHFIDEDVFQKLLAIREEIYQATEINVSPRKLANMLLRQANFKQLRDQLIQQYA